MSKNRSNPTADSLTVNQPDFTGIPIENIRRQYIRNAEQLCGMSNAPRTRGYTRQDLQLRSLAQYLRGMGFAKVSVEDHENVVTFQDRDGLYYVAGGNGGEWSADVYGSFRAFQDGAMPVGDVHTGKAEYGMDVAKKIADMIKAAREF